MPSALCPLQLCFVAQTCFSAALGAVASGVFDALPSPALAINLGTGRGTTVRELLAAFNDAVSRPIEARAAGRRPGDVAGAYTRIDRARRLLDWAPQYDIHDGIRHSLRWAAIRDEVLPGSPLRSAVS